MGAVSCFYIVTNDIIEQIEKQNFGVNELDDFLEKELDLNPPFELGPAWRNRFSFGTNKGWSATQEVFNFLDSSEKKVLCTIIRDNTDKTWKPVFKKNEEVQEIWDVLKNISVADFEAITFLARN